jgi:hypothetical protein
MKTVAKENPGAACDGNQGQGIGQETVNQYPKGQRKSKTLSSVESDILAWPCGDVERRKMREAWSLLAFGLCTSDIQALRLIRAIEANVHLGSLQCWLTNERLASLANCSLSAVKDGLSVLARRGVIRWTTALKREHGIITGRKRVIELTLPVGMPATLEAMQAALDSDSTEGCSEQPSEGAPKGAQRVSPKGAQRSRTEGCSEQPTPLIRKYPDKNTLKRADARDEDSIFEEHVFNGCGSLESYRRDLTKEGVFFEGVAFAENLRRGAMSNAKPCFDDIHGCGSFVRLPEPEKQRLRERALDVALAKFGMTRADLSEGALA